MPYLPIERLEFRIPIPSDQASETSLKGLIEPNGPYRFDRTSLPPSATKELANGDRVIVTRLTHDDGRQEILASYVGTLRDAGTVSFALSNMLADLCDLGIFPHPDYSRTAERAA